MSDIFISHSSRDAELVSKLVDLLETGAGVHGRGIFASSIAGKGVPYGDFTAYIRDQLSRAKVALFVLSPDFDLSPFCVAEMGAVWALKIPVLLYVTPSLTRADVRGVFEGAYQVERLDDQSSVDKLRDIVQQVDVSMTPAPVARWNAQSRAFVEWLTTSYVDAPPGSPRPVEDQPGWGDRGHWSADIVDATLYAESSIDVDLKQKIMREIEQGRMPSTVYSYLTDSGFHHWMQLTHDPEYRYFAESVHYFREHSGRTTDAVLDAIGTPDVDFVSLGPGDGQKDLLLLRSLANRVSDVRALYYYPFDVNLSMISSAVRWIGGDARLRRIKVKAILANFDSLAQFAPIFHYRGAANVLSLLGNTLGNFTDERGFLERIFYGAMLPGDVLLLEVRNKEEGRGPDLGRDRSKKFNFGPLEILGFELDPDKMEYVELTTPRSTVPGTATSLARYRDVSVGRSKRDTVDLAVINRYDPHGLTAVCREIGFRQLQDPAVYRSVAAVLLQKPMS